MEKPSMDKGLFTTVFRVVSHSRRSPKTFIYGALWRTAERLLDLFPILVCYYWFCETLKLEVTTTSGTNEVYNQLLTLPLSLSAIFFLQWMCAWYGQKYSFLGGYDIMSGYRDKLINRVHQIPLATLSRYRAGKLADMLTDDISKIENIFTHLAIDLLVSTTVPILLALGLFFVDWQLSVALLAGFPIALLIIQLTRSLTIKVSQEKQETIRHISGVLVEFTQGLKILRLINKAPVWLQKLSGLFDQITQKSIRVEAWAAGPVVAYRLVIEMGIVCLILLSAWKLEHNQTEPLVIIFFFFLAHRLVSPLLDMAQYLNIIRYATQGEIKMEELFKTSILPEPKVAKRPDFFSVRFSNVDFSYDETTCLRNISFTAQPDTITAIVGPSGSGKSTLLNLISRFSDPACGTVSIGGHDLKEIGSDGVYQNLSVVFQKVQLFSGSVIENIRIGSPKATQQDIIEACKKACCHEFIAKLPQGYDTQIGESGTRLSGGERQRISIARAFLKRAPILLLDEITASVDAITQHAIQKSLAELVQGKTVIMVAHRLNTVVNADQILVLNNGKIIQAGKHQDLFATEGLYKDLWQAQYS